MVSVVNGYGLRFALGERRRGFVAGAIGGSRELGLGAALGDDVLGSFSWSACWLRFVAGIVELGLEALVDGSEGEDGGDASQVEPVVEKLADL